MKLYEDNAGGLWLAHEDVVYDVTETNLREGIKAINSHDWEQHSPVPTLNELENCKHIVTIDNKDDLIIITVPGIAGKKILKSSPSTEYGHCKCRDCMEIVVDNGDYCCHCQEYGCDDQVETECLSPYSYGGGEDEL